ncbi:MAG: hypothetical protein HY679_11420 [Chloroflexi bacterium]|nr:hypothetical protein [Chloroflexota bacterium]
MPENFFIRLREYYLNVAAVLRGEADSASIFPNSTDVGQSREKVYAEFLRLHAPSKCNVFLGGFLFDHENGNESKQLDIIVTTDTTPRFDLHNRDGSGKSFSPVEGTLGVVSSKSMLNKAELEDALLGIASIPPTSSLDGRVSFAVQIMNYEDWPYKVIYATDGIDGGTLLSHLVNFYNTHPEIPICRRPDLIHVAGKYIVIRATPGLSVKKTSGLIETPEPGEFRLFTTDSDLQGIVWVLTQLQDLAAASTEISYSYRSLINKVNLQS